MRTSRIVRGALALLAGIVASANLPMGAAAPAGSPIANVSHRGASGWAPEHTLAAYDLALEMGADFIEQDLQQTADGVLVVLHDATLDRTVRGPVENCVGPVNTKTLAQIKTCDAGSWFNESYPERARPEYVGLKVPTLEEVFQRYGKKVRYYIETKNPEVAPGMDEALVDLIERYGLREGAVTRWQVLIQSFSPESLIKINALDPALPLIQLGLGGDQQTLEATSRYSVGIGPSFGGVTKELVDSAHALCLDVHPYTVNDVEDMQGLIDMGVDGMFTNYPDRLAELKTGGHYSAARAAAEFRQCRDDFPLKEKGGELQHFVGALHEHSAYSDGYPGSRPADYLASGKSFGLDFMGGSEHSDNLGVPFVLNEECLTPAIASCAIADDDNAMDSFRKWDAIQEQSAAATDEDFTAFRGFEWSSDRNGHINVYFSDNYTSDKTDGGNASLETFYRWLRTPVDMEGGSDGIAVFNHPGGKKLHDSDPAVNWNNFAYVPSLDYRFVGLEVYNRTRNYDPYFVQALDRGWHVGAVGAEDLGHVREDQWGAPEYAKTVIIAEDNDAPSLHEAMLARRFYAILDPAVRIEMDADGEPMGSRILRAPGENVTISATVPGAYSTELVTGGGQIVATGSGSSSKLHYKALATKDEAWYFVRVIDAGGQVVGYSSPVWITADAVLD